MFFRAVQFELIQGHSVGELRNGSGRPLSNGRSGKETNTSCLQKLGINTAELEGAGDPVNGEHISSNAVVDFMYAGKAHHFIESIVHHVEKALVHFALAPEEALAILDPFEVTNGDAAGIAENVRHSEDALGIDNRVGLPSGGTVGALAENPGLHLLGVLLGDLVFDGRGNGDLARLEEDIARGHFRSTARKFLERLLLGVHPVDHLRHIEALLVVETTADVREANDFVAGFLHVFRCQGANVAEALNHDAAALFFDSQFREGFVAANHHAAPGGFFPAARAAEFNGLAGDDGGGGLTDVHRVRVHDPSHGLFVGADVGRWDVALRTQPIGQFRGVAASEPLEFSAGHLPRIADHPAFGSAKRNIYHRALPGHPGRKRADFIDGYVGSKTDSALAWPAHRRMQHAIAGEHFQSSVIHPDGNVEGDFFAGVFEIAVKPLLESQFVRGDFKARFRVLVDIHFFRHGSLRHAKFSFGTARYSFVRTQDKAAPA